MSFLKRLFSQGRVRSASRRLVEDPSARGYAELAHEHALQGDLDEALRLANEGLSIHAGDAELRRVHERLRQLSLEGRMRELQQELKTSPRPAVWSELCQILIEAGRVARAEDTAVEWYQGTKHPEALYWRARARTQRFFSDKRRDDGRLAFELIESLEGVMPTDPRPQRLRLELASRCGAWSEARRAIARLLELHPGDPALEARFRSVVSLADAGRTIDQALRAVERTGRLVDEEPATLKPSAYGDVRPHLQALARENGVRAVFYVRGATALVQGPKGPTADRMARGVREVVASCRTAARRMGLGQTTEIALEGTFGTLSVRPDEMASAAVWCTGEVTTRHEEALDQLLASGGNEAEEGR